MDDEPDHNGRINSSPLTPEENAARAASGAFDRQLIITVTKIGLATTAAFVAGLIARLCGITAVAHLTGWSLIPLVLLLTTDAVVLAWRMARSSQLWFIGTTWKLVTGGRQPFQIDSVLQRHARCLTDRTRPVRRWLTWIIHIGYAACGGLVVANWASGLIGAGVCAVMIGLRAWIHRVLSKQKTNAASALNFMGGTSERADSGD